MSTYGTRQFADGHAVSEITRWISETWAETQDKWDAFASREDIVGASCEFFVDARKAHGEYTYNVHSTTTIAYATDRNWPDLVNYEVLAPSSFVEPGEGFMEISRRFIGSINVEGSTIVTETASGRYFSKDSVIADFSDINAIPAITGGNEVLVTINQVYTVREGFGGTSFDPCMTETGTITEAYADVMYVVERDLVSGDRRVRFNGLSSLYAQMLYVVGNQADDHAYLANLVPDPFGVEFLQVCLSSDRAGGYNVSGALGVPAEDQVQFGGPIGVFVNQQHCGDIAADGTATLSDADGTLLASADTFENMLGGTPMDRGLSGPVYLSINVLVRDKKTGQEYLVRFADFEPKQNVGGVTGYYTGFVPIQDNDENSQSFTLDFAF